MSIKKTVKYISLLGVFCLVNACVSTPSPHLKDNDSSLLQTRVAFLPSCPGQNKEAQRESLAVAATAQLIAPLIDTTYDAVTAAIKAAGTDEEVSFSGQTVSRFYNATPKTNPTTTLTPYELFENRNNNCLIVVHGYFAKDYSAADLSALSTVGLNSTHQEILKKHFGLTAIPQFYYEGKLFYSAERSAFRIKTEKIYYPERLIDHNVGDRQSKLLLTFAKPGAGVDGTPFATGKIDISRAKKELQFNGGDRGFNGISKLRKDIQTAFGTSYMPLPALGESTKTALSTAKTRLSTYATSSRAYLETTKKIGIDTSVLDVTKPSLGQDLSTLLETPANQALIKGKLNSLNVEIKDLGTSIQTQTLSLDSDLIKASQSIEDLENPAKTDLEKAKRVKARRQFILYAQTKLALDKANLAKKIELRTQVKALAKAANALKVQTVKIELEKNRLAQIQPFTLTATLTETRFGNPVAKFISDIMTGSKEGFTTALKEGLDPVTRDKLKDDAKKEADALQSKKDTARRTAVQAVFEYRAAEIALATLDVTATDASRLEVDKTLALETIDVENACRDAEALGVAPPSCSAF